MTKSTDMNKTVTEGKVVGTINVTPKWADLHPIYSEWIDSGTPEQKQLVKDELLKLCKLADHVNEAKDKNSAR